MILLLPLLAFPKCFSSALLLPVRYVFPFDLLAPSDLAPIRVFSPLVTRFCLFHRRIRCDAFVLVLGAIN